MLFHAQRNKHENTHTQRGRENEIKGNFYGNEEQTYGISIVYLFYTILFNENCHFLFAAYVNKCR